MSGTFYRAFEERYRGSRDLIKSRLSIYIPFISPLNLIFLAPQVLDLGCGRGEWLEITRALGFEARGVDLDDGMVLECHDLNLNACKADAVQTLIGMPDESVAIVSAFHLIEHIAFDNVQILIKEALRVLRPGGLLILETPNSENLVVGTSTFYLDPSHIKPVPVTLIKFAIEHAGFEKAKIIRLQESCILGSSKKLSLSDVLTGVSPYYGVVAQKQASADILSRFDAAFSTNFGISLDEVANLYDEQLKLYFTQLELVTARASESALNLLALDGHIKALRINAIEQAQLAKSFATGISENAIKINSLDAQGLQNTIQIKIMGSALKLQVKLDTKIQQATERINELELSNQKLHQSLGDIYNSRSWRFTMATRNIFLIVQIFPKLVRVFNRQITKLPSFIRSKASLKIRQFLLKNSSLKSIVMRHLNQRPRLKNYLRTSIRDDARPHDLPAGEKPRVLRIFNELKRSMEKRNK